MNFQSNYELRMRRQVLRDKLAEFAPLKVA